MTDHTAQPWAGLPPDALERVDALCERFEAAWKSGTPPALPEYLAAVSARGRAALLAELLALEREYRRRRDEAPIAEDYARLLPDHATLVRRLWAEGAPGSGSGSHTFITPAPIELPVRPWIGLELPGYELLRELGRGGMGVVYLARQVKLNRLVALKMIAGPGHPERKDQERIRAEAEAVARLRHPNIVQIYEVGEYQGLPYLALEYVEGGSLADRLDGSPWPMRQAARLVEQLAGAVQHAHQAGIIHRDLKPANILLSFSRDPQGSAGSALPCGSRLNEAVPQVSDFGLAKLLESDSGQTRTGDVLGTPRYMAPEQAAGRNKDVGPATDVHALGILLYELLTGRPPFQGATVLETLDQVRNQDPVTPRQLQPRLARGLQTICLKCLHKEPARRYASAQALADDLRRWQAGEPIRARRAGAVEHGWRWCRRNPALAGALLGVALALALGTAVAWGFAVQARENASAAEANARRADQETQEAQDNAHRANARAYVSDLRLIQRYWEESLPVDLSTLLDGQRPEKTAGVDLRGFEWHYWWRLSHALSSFSGHAAHINSVAFSPDGRRITSASDDGTVIVWDAATGQKRLTFRGHGGIVRCAAFSPDGRRIVSVGMDGTVKVWDAQTGQEQLTLRGHTGPVWSAAFSPDGHRIVTSSADRTAKVWDAQTGEPVFSLGGHARDVRWAAFSPDGRRLATASWDRTVKVWDAATGQEQLTLRGHTADVQCVCFSPDGRRLASGGDDSKAKVWDAATGQELLTLKGRPRGLVFCVAFSPDGRRILSGGIKATVKVWDAATGQEQFTFKGHTEAVSSVAFSPDGRRIVSGSWDRTLKVWDAQASPAALTLLGHQSQVAGVAVSPDGQRLASAASDWDGGASRYVNGELRVWETKSGRTVLNHEGQFSGVTCVAFSPDGKSLASGRGAWDEQHKQYTSGEVRLLDPMTGEERALFSGHSGCILCLAFSPDGRLLASAGFDGTIKVWEVEAAREAFTLPGHAKAVTSLAFSPDGRLLASGGFDTVVKVWDVRARAEARSLPAAGMVSGVAFNPEGDRLAACGYYTSGVQVWETATGRQVLTLKGHAGYVTAVAFSPDGKRVVTAGEDNTLRLWETEAGQEVLTLKGHTNIVRSVAFSRDGRRLISGGWDRTVRVWDASPPAEGPADPTDREGSRGPG
jgi:WD40 repeat protein